jgi:hypothetical protein
MWWGIAERIVILDTEYLLDKNYVYMTLKESRKAAWE